MELSITVQLCGVNLPCVRTLEAPRLRSNELLVLLPGELGGGRLLLLRHICCFLKARMRVSLKCVHNVKTSHSEYDS